MMETWKTIWQFVFVAASTLFYVIALYIAVRASGDVAGMIARALGRPVAAESDTDHGTTDLGGKAMAGSAFPIPEMDRVGEEFDGRFGIYVEELNSGAVYACCADERFPTASVCKVSVMIELFRQAEEGRLSLDDRRRFDGDTICRGGSPILDRTRDAPELTLRDYCRLMITISDNTATDFLIGVVGDGAVNAMLDEMGYPLTRTSVTMGRYHYRMAGLGDDVVTCPENDELYKQRMKSPGADYGAISYTDSPENNVAAPREMADMLKKIHLGQMLSPASSEEMLGLLKEGRDRRMIPRYIEPEITIAHKYGSSGIIKGNVGIVYLPTGPLVVAGFALTTPGGDGEQGSRAIGRVTRMAAAAFSPESVVEEDE